MGDVRVWERARAEIRYSLSAMGFDLSAVTDAELDEVIEAWDEELVRRKTWEPPEGVRRCRCGIQFRDVGSEKCPDCSPYFVMRP